MSGFVAVLNTDRAPLEPERLSDLTEAMAFRGPDARHTWSDGHVGLGHALLRTSFESETERQPCSLDGRAWITGDARIDGRAALVARLHAERRDVAEDAPDPELILHAYLAWGEACLDRLIGDFAFVLWDSGRHRLLAARDQLGVAQLFHARTGDTLLLGNTLAGLLRHPRLPDTLDQRALADVAVFGMYGDDAATSYAAVRRLAPGHRLTWDGTDVRLERYWGPHEPAPVRYRRAEEYTEHFSVLFDAAVADRLRADRAGSQLSGGMDSTSVTVTARRQLQATGRPFDLRAYTTDHRSLIPDEEPVFAGEVARHADFRLEVLAAEDYPDAEPTWVAPEPGPVNLRIMGEICRRTTTFARVLLTGYGGDPLLDPPDFSWRRAAAALRRGNWRWPAERLAAGRHRRRQGPTPLPAWVDPQWARRMDLTERAALFHRRARREQTGVAEAPVWRSLFAWSDAGYNGLPLSIRFPFFDLRLLEFVLAIPPTPWLEDKRLLREAMAGRVPERVRTRAKTVMPGDAAVERDRRTGVPLRQLELVAASEVAEYVDTRWIDSVRHRPAEAQAQMWAAERPPVDLAYWLRYRSARRI